MGVNEGEERVRSDLRQVRRMVASGWVRDGARDKNGEFCHGFEQRAAAWSLCSAIDAVAYKGMPASPLKEPRRWQACIDRHAAMTNLLQNEVIFFWRPETPHGPGYERDLHGFNNASTQQQVLEMIDSALVEDL